MAGQTDNSFEISLGYWPTINALYHQQYRQSGLVTQVFTGRGAIDKDLLDSALQAAQARHPLLHCRMVEAERRFILVPAPANSPVKLECRIADQQSAFEIAAQLMSEDVGEQLWRVVLVESRSDPQSWSIIMLCHHAVCDAQATCAFLDELLTAYANLAAGRPAVPESLELQLQPTALRAESISESAQQADCQVAAEWEADSVVPLQQRQARWLKIPVDPEILEPLLVACRREQVSVTHIITAALLRAKGITQCSRVTTAIDFRRRVEPAIGYEHFGCFIGMLESAIPWAEGIWDHARSCAEFQFRKLDRTLRSVLEKPAMPLLEMLMTARINKGMENAVFAGGCAISNAGVLPTSGSYGPLQIEEVHFTTLQLAGLYSVFLSVVTHAGGLYISLSYAEPLMSRRAAEILANNFVGQLNDCCA